MKIDLKNLIAKFNLKTKFNKSLIKKAAPLIFVGLVIVAGSVYFIKNQSHLSKLSKGQVLSSEEVQFLSSEEASKKAIEYINKNLLQQGMTASLVNVVDENGVYKFKITISGQEYDSYVSKDGKLLFAEAIDLDVQPAAQPQENSQPQQEVQKKDVVDVKLFVMSYCPYGLQAEKALLPVWELLKEKANFGIYFVDYAMHDKKEIDENLRQYCIEKEQTSKFVSYLNCFVEGGDFSKCLTAAGIDQQKLKSCESATDNQFKIAENYQDKSLWLNGTYPKFLVNSDLTKKYGVQGSPTLVLNDVLFDPSQRSPEAFKESICKGFKNPPAECSQKLSSEVSSAGIGASSGNASSGGSCQ